mmetsp:Transcript_6778/g.9466  ORF Transcript_6778/g.9466 Transcript_6778/m.9466 type:complete len:250 (-) Transcript_6778:30-779(-)
MPFGVRSYPHSWMTTPRETSASPDARWRAPLRNAPRPRIVWKVSFWLGSYTTPRVSCRFTAKPTETQQAGKPWTKFVVPSIGSTTQVFSAVSASIWPASPEASSPMNLSSGKWARRVSKINRSLDRSVSVTRSMAPLKATFLFCSIAIFIALPALRATWVATRSLAVHSESDSSDGMSAYAPGMISTPSGLMLATLSGLAAHIGRKKPAAATATPAVATIRPRAWGDCFIMSMLKMMISLISVQFQCMM